MWYLVSKETGQQVCYSKRKEDLLALLKDKPWSDKWELVFK